ncbi:hypothetical protein [Halocynthiibacter sp.]|uniref:hypothetical protein n=1 Tax=Halocynthiibacter sp. TaxID=1979210 RepID=UPI003C461B57
MNLIADILLVAGALGASLYCFVLSRRLAKFNDLEQGVGGAVAILSVQVDDMTKTLGQVQTAAVSSTDTLETLTVRAEAAARRLELLVASLHDLPAPPEPTPPKPPENVQATTSETSSEPSSDILFLRHPTPPQEASQ